LETTLQGVDASLQLQINEINETLKAKIAEFTKGIADNKTSIEDINDTIEKMQKAYEAAEKLIQSNMQI